MCKQIFFVTNHSCIYKRIFPLIEKRKDKGEIIIVTISDDSYKFFKEYTDFTIINTKVTPSLVTQKTYHRLLINVIKSKLEYHRLFRHIKDADIFFCTSALTIVTFSYIKKLAETNNVYHYIDTPQPIKKEKCLIARIMKMISGFFLDVPIEIKKAEGRFICFLGDDRFFCNIIKRYDEELDTSTNINYLKHIEMKDKKILFLTSDITDYVHFVKRCDMNNLANIVLDVFQDRLDECITKGHPDNEHEPIYGDLHKIDIMPSYIPAEFLLHHDWDFVISIASTSIDMFIRNSDTKIISLMDMIHWIDPDAYAFREDFFSELPILLPKNKQELKKMIKG